MVAAADAAAAIAGSFHAVFLSKRHAHHADEADSEPLVCEPDMDDNDDRLGARISAVFVVLIASAFGSFFPVLSSRYSVIRMPPWCFFVAKFFGSGVIVATAFIHLMEPASDALGNECLGGVFTAYPMAFGIALMSLFAMFFGELATHAYVDDKLAARGLEANDHAHAHSHFGDEAMLVLGKKEAAVPDKSSLDKTEDLELSGLDSDSSLIAPDYYGQLLSVFILEFGILFHSVFVGLALSVSGEEFTSLYIVVVFHQMFEGLGLGSRIAITPWPKNRRLTPWLLCAGYTLVTPIAIAIGLGVRTTYDQGSRKALITNGVFDAISAGILFYAGLVELIAHEFFYAGQFKGPGGAKKSFLAFIVMCFGAGLMALLGKWA